jgi:hypothetical protein
MRYRPQLELAAFWTNQSPGCSAAKSSSSTAAVGPLTVSSASCAASPSGAGRQSVPFAEGAAAERREHAVAGREARVAPRALDAADALEPRRARQRLPEGRRALDGAQVGDVHRGRLHAQHDLALGGVAGVLLHDAQHLARRAVGLVHRGAAQRIPRSVMRAIASACRARK